VRFTPADRAVPVNERPFARLEIVSSGYLETLGIPVLEGRGFDARDTLQSPGVMLVNQELVRRYFPREPLLGRSLLGIRQTNPMVVGVVGDVKARPVALGAEPTIYLAMSQSPLYRTRLAIRTHGDPNALLPMIRRVMTSIDPELPVFDVRTLRHITTDAVATQRFALLLFALFGALALGLSVIGIYGVMAYAVAHRLPEFGVRVALGARPRQLLRMVFLQGARMALAGIALGAGASLLVARWIEGLLFGVRPFDPATLAAVGALFCVIALAACLLPAERAARVDPMKVLRNE
jgi:predicted permease